MKRGILLFAGLFAVLMLLFGLNAVTSNQEDVDADTEAGAERTTYNYGSTGFHAYFDLLQNQKFSVSRINESLDNLGEFNYEKMGVLVLASDPIFPYSEREISAVDKWVYDGGRLIIIDRFPDPRFFFAEKDTAYWKVSIKPSIPSKDILSEIRNSDPSSENSMVGDSPLGKVLQPSLYTEAVNAIRPSKFATSAQIEFITEAEKGTKRRKLKDMSPIWEEGAESPPQEINSNIEFETPVGDDGNAIVDSAKLSNETSNISDEEGNSGSNSFNSNLDAAAEDQEPTAIELKDDSFINGESTKSAPLVLVSDGEKNLVTQIRFGNGEIVWVTDPYILSNAGISLQDNIQLGLNLVNTAAPIVFDEYHHGYGRSENRLFIYFQKTPVFAIILQLVALIALLMFSQSRRFARPIPLDEPNRLSKLEYISAIAQLQQRTKAYDLALENIYRDFKLRACRRIGADPMKISNEDLARRIAETIGWDPSEVEQVLNESDDVVFGAKAGSRQTLKLVRKIREMEGLLGIARQRQK